MSRSKSPHALKYVALLRGINVGGNSKVEMSRLKKLFEELGHTEVSSYINSGNLIFASSRGKKELLQEIEAALHKTFEFEIRVILRTYEEIRQLAEGIPKDWKNDSEQKTDVLFLWDDFDRKETLKLLEANPEVDELKYFPGAIVWHLDRAHYNKSGMGKLIGTKVYKNMTARNVNTVRKLAELMKS